jgi:hypothetical protein
METLFTNAFIVILETSLALALLLVKILHCYEGFRNTYYTKRLE